MRQMRPPCGSNYLFGATSSRWLWRRAMYHQRARQNCGTGRWRADSAQCLLQLSWRQQKGKCSWRATSTPGLGTGQTRMGGTLQPTCAAMRASDCALGQWRATHQRFLPCGPPAGPQQRGQTTCWSLKTCWLQSQPAQSTLHGGNQITTLSRRC